MAIDHNDVNAGAAIYSRQVLAIYDLSMLIFFKFVWQCPTIHVLELYNDNISSNHLDVGVGSGYYLDQCQFPSDNPNILLLDLNHNSLSAAARRISRYRPEMLQANALEPILLKNTFDSVGLGSLLHCLPGTIKDKAVIFENLRPLMNPGGVIFGCTLINGGVSKHWFARQAMQRLNAKKIFCNLQDNADDLQEALSKRFFDSNVRIIGCMALFTARTPV